MRVVSGSIWLRIGTTSEFSDGGNTVSGFVEDILLILLD
jgi:hypothetical protein